RGRKQTPAPRGTVTGSELTQCPRENDINAVNASYETLLHIAAANGQIAVMEYLIKKGAKLEVKDSQGKTPLHRAAEKGHDDAVKVLLQAGAYIYSLDEAAKTPLHLAAQNHHSHILNRILKEEAKRYRNQHSFLHMAALKDDSSLAQMILKNGATVDAKDEKGQSALGYAVSQGFEKTVKVLNNQSIFEVLLEYFKAVQKNLHGIVAALVDKGTDINVYNEMGYTPLLMACELGKTESAEVLLEKGASLKEKMPNSDTGLSNSFCHVLFICKTFVLIPLSQVSLYVSSLVRKSDIDMNTWQQCYSLCVVDQSKAPPSLLKF
uniref:Ankyrin 1 n=1 Tax=Crocodylus porosus TaxID=8502 RepID=A0A7M4EET9_CROPO